MIYLFIAGLCFGSAIGISIGLAVLRCQLKDIKRKEMLKCPDTHFIVWDEDKDEYSCTRCEDKFREK